MATLNMASPDVSELAPSLVLLLWDQVTGSNILAGDVTVQIGATAPKFRASEGQFVFGPLTNGSYNVSVKSVPDEPYYVAAGIPVTLPFPRPADTSWDQQPAWVGYPDIVLADPNKTLDDPAQTAAYLAQRALATLSPTTSYPFPPGATLLRGSVTALGVPLSGALVTTSPLAQPGQYSVAVSNPGSVTSSAHALTVVNKPMAYSIEPSLVIAGTSAFSLIMEGCGFLPGTVVHWNSAPLSTTFLDSSTLMAEIATDLVAAATQVKVTAVTPDGTTSNPQILTVASAPSITSIYPPRVTAGGAGFTLGVQGSGFLPGAVVQLKGTALATTWLGSTALRAQVLAGQMASAAQLNVSVKNPGAKAKLSNVQVLAVGSAPVLNVLEPAAIVAGSAAFTLSVTGSGFDSGSVVTLDGASLPTIVHNQDQLTAHVTAVQVAAAATWNVAVSNPRSATSNSLTFQVLAAPVIHSLEPTSVTAGPAAFVLVLRGTGFVSGSLVELDGTPISTTFVDSAELNAHVPRSGYTTGTDGTFVLLFDDIAGVSQARTVVATHPSYPTVKTLDVTLLRGATVSASIEVSE